jgi:uncharacterized coiled-coil DUF342 family protein
VAVERSDQLKQRRSELAGSLPQLNEQRDSTYRLNSDARALDRAGVKHEGAQELTRLGEAEVAADAEIRAVQRELRDIDTEIALMPRRRLGMRLGRAARRKA